MVLSLMMMTLTVSEELLARDMHTHRHTHRFRPSTLKFAKLLTALQTKRNPSMKQIHASCFNEAALCSLVKTVGNC